MAPSVGFIGVGNMGNPMAGNVLKTGFPMTVFDKNPGAMANLVQAGAQKAASAQEVVERSVLILYRRPAECSCGNSSHPVGIGERGVSDYHHRTLVREWVVGREPPESQGPARRHQRRQIVPGVNEVEHRR